MSLADRMGELGEHAEEMLLEPHTKKGRERREWAATSLAARLAADATAQAAWGEIEPSMQEGFVRWIADPSSAAGREERLAEAVGLILAGPPYGEHLWVGGP